MSILKLVPNKNTLCVPAVPPVWASPVANLTTKACPKLCLGQGPAWVLSSATQLQEGKAGQENAGLHIDSTSAQCSDKQWSAESYSMFQKKVFEHFG